MSIIDTVYVSVRVLDVPPEFLQLPFHIYIYIYIEKINNNSIFFYSIKRKEEEIRKWNRIFRMKESQTMAKVRFIIVGSGQPTFSRRGEKFEPIELSIGM